MKFSRFFKIVIGPIGLMGLIMMGLFWAHPTFAVDTGLTSDLATTTGLGDTDVRIIIARVINVALGLLGVIAVALIVYSGFLWMTSAGNPDRIKKAKAVMINAIIGLLIILSSYAITTYVLDALLAATNPSSSSSSSSSASASGSSSASSLFTVSGASPQDTQTIKNLTVRLTFNKEVDESTVAGNIAITANGATAPVDGTFSVNGRKVTFRPNALCDGYTDVYCFDGDTDFTITIDTGLKSTSGLAVTCGGLYNACSYAFTSGNLIDTQAPDVTVTYPDDGASLEEQTTVTLQATVTDDAGVSLVEFYVDGELVGEDQPDGSTPLEFTAQYDWDDSAYTTGQSYDFYAVAYDVDDNQTTSDTVSAIVRAAHCFNGATDSDETGEDCGGADCGACGGSSCTAASDCASGVCESGVCVDYPAITGISPLNGAVGTYVTISGENFGSRTGSVYFGDTRADLASCADTWTTSQIIAIVPDGLTSGTNYTITVTTDGGYSDTNQDDNGPLVDDFAVNDTVRPGICAIDPSEDLVGQIIGITGVNFGSSRGTTSYVYFDTTEAGAYNTWHDTSLRVTVPTLAVDTYDMSVVVNGVSSNTASFDVIDESASNLPVIGSIDPDTGPVGEYVTITGSNFGSSIGAVYFVNTDTSSGSLGVQTIGDVDFPVACAEDYWGQDQIIVKVPEGLDTSATSYQLYVERQDSVDSDPVDFTLSTGAADPGVCSVEPSTGPAGYQGVTIAGEGFGSSSAQGSVTFFSSASTTSATTASVTSWDDGTIVVNVPSDASTGPLTVYDKDANASNTTNFTVGDCTADTSLCDPNTQQCCDTGICLSIGSTCPTAAAALSASYAWVFSTGPIPEYPEVDYACNSSEISPTPWDGRTGGNGESVCVNAAISATFSLAMDETTLTSDNIALNLCTGTSSTDPCATTTAVALGTITTTSTSFTVSPVATLSASSTYQVTLGSSIKSYNGNALTPTSWTFETRSSSELCEMSSVLVVPSTETITDQYGTANFNAQAVSSDACVILNSSSYSWAWATDGRYADLATATASCTGAPSSCQVIEGVQETPAASPTYVTASSLAYDDSANLTINFTDPYVVDQWPDCSEACINAAIIAEFNTAMDTTSLATVGTTGVFECTDENCDSFVDAGGLAGTVTVSTDQTTFTFTPDSYLTADTYYRVVITGEASSTSGVTLQDSAAATLNYNNNQDYSWTFKTRTDTAACAIDRVDMNPPSALVDYIGAKTTFEAQAYGPADDCSVSGQPLTSTSYDWSWQVANTLIATLWKSGTVEVASDRIPSGCTSACVAEGTQSYSAICGEDADGNGSPIDPGEDCDNGTGARGNGCSVTCLNIGTTACASSTDANCCGNSVLDTGEQCDDAGSVSGDGCSATCLDEGSREAGTTCGDGHVTPDPVTNPLGGGESCDDGNTVSGDGCSSICLNEGSSIVASLTGICGDRTIDTPAEECDDGNTSSGDGCTSTCLSEGYAACTSTVTTNCCGNGSIEKTSTGVGETCDDGNTANDDGCSSRCLLEGSSTSYSSPSFCGDANVGTGEQSSCEVSSSVLDGLVEPTQVTVIADTAPAQVSPTTHEAQTDVTASAEGTEGTAPIVLDCSCAADSDCSDETALGCGTTGCCYARPSVDSYAPTASDVCRNSAIYIDFDQEMDTASFADNVTIAIHLARAETCPYTATTARARGFFGRIWEGLVRLFHVFVPPTSAASTTCLLPFTVSSEMISTGQRIYFSYAELLEADTSYVVSVAGDPSHTGAGVRSVNGVGLDTNFTYGIRTGSDYCTLDGVTVTDTSADSPNYFSTTREAHDYTAVAYSVVGGAQQELQSIPDVYAWTWGTWSVSDATIFSVDSSADPEGDSAVVTALGQNGDAEISVTATISADMLLHPSTVDDGATGTTSSTAFLCVNPWPAVGSFPFEDSADAVSADPDGDGTDEIAKRSGYMHFSTYYCRDTGVDGLSDDYSAVDVSAVATPPGDVLKEYLFEVAGSSDVVGIRVVPNENLYSIATWYADQGFTGSPSDTTVDGYQALTDGRTTYVSVSNLSDTGLIYANVYAISYNANADAATIALYDQMLENWSFNTNVTNTGLCYEEDTDHDSSNDVLFADNNGDSVSCTADMDCASENCHADKDKLTRDLKRLTDLRDMEAILTEYGASNGRCSASTSTSCTDDSDCPNGESCEPLYPALISGTFVPAYDVSPWDSWSSALETELGTSIPVDPLNHFDGCSEGSYTSYASTSCWDATDSQFVCPSGSHVYLYRNIGGTAYDLQTDLEYAYTSGSTSWAYSLDQDTTDNLDLTVGSAFSSSVVDGYQRHALCGGRVVGSSKVCGDGLLGSSETCEIGDTGEALCTAAVCVSADADYDGLACEVDCTTASTICTGDANSDGICDGGYASGQACDTGEVDCTDATLCSSATSTANNGTQASVCNDACSGYSVSTEAACVPMRCGNGVIEGTETCDDGTHNGDYGYCGSSCTLASGFYCGDSTLAGGETCDLGANNGVYNASAASTCSSTCDSAGPSCGDSVVNGPEECDGTDATWSDGLCADGTECSSDSDCTDSSVCGAYYFACPVAKICQGGSKDGYICEATEWPEVSSAYLLSANTVWKSQCTAGGGTCTDDTTYQTSRTHPCEDSTCTYDSWTTCYAADQYCGNGTVEGAEECDDGNADNNDDCTTECTSNVCGDGYLYTGYETCDEGSDNGTICDAGFGETCRYCSVTCNYLTASGDYCGDGVLNTGDEYCDATTFSSYRCYQGVNDIDVDNDGRNDSCVTLGSKSECGGTYACTEVGVCNGGTYGGQFCSTDSSCGTGYNCVKPQCASDCGSTCPFTYDAQDVSITSEEAGSSPQTSLALYPYGSNDSPDRATLTIPACTAQDSLRVDIDGSNRTYGDVDVMFLLDRSTSMADELDGLRTAVANAADTLFSAYVGTGGTMRIGLAYVSGLHANDDDGDGKYSTNELTYGTTTKPFVILDPTDSETDVLTAIDTYFSATESGGTPLLTAMHQTINAVINSEAEAKYIVLFTDGSIYNTCEQYDMIAEHYGLVEDASSTYESGSSGTDTTCSSTTQKLDDEYMQKISYYIDDAKTHGVTFFTAGLTASTCELTQLDRFSNDTCTASNQSCVDLWAEGNYTCDVSSDTGLTYAFSVTSESDFQTMFDEIVDSILSIQVTVTDRDGNVGGASVQAGDNIAITLPRAFVCDDNAAQDVAFHIYWNGGGTITFDNFSLDLCSP